MYKSTGGSLNRGEERKTFWSGRQLISLQVALEGWCHPPAGRNLANGWPQCRCRNQKICQQGLDLLVSGIYRISDDQGQLPEGREPRKSTEYQYPYYSLARSGPRADLLQSGLECRQANYLLSHWICIESLSSHFLPLHASSVLLAQLENNVAEVFTPPNASVSPESRVLSSLVLVLSCLVVVAVLFLFSALPVANQTNPTFPTLAWGPS